MSNLDAANQFEQWKTVRAREQFPTNVPWLWVPRIGTITLAEPGPDGEPVQQVLASIRRIKRALKVDKKGADGANGATITIRGYDPTEFVLDLEAWNEEGYALMRAVIALAFPRHRDAKGATKPEPLEIAHPALSLHGVTAFVAETLEGPEWSDQRLKAAIGCVEWRPPLKKAVAGTGSATVTPAKVRLSTFTPEVASAVRATRGRTESAAPNQVGAPRTPNRRIEPPSSARPTP